MTLKHVVKNKINIRANGIQNLNFVMYVIYGLLIIAGVII